jgi:predicted permease
MFTALRHITARLRAFFTTRELDRDFAQELESHVAMLTEENIRRGMSRDEARRLARVRVGAGASMKDQHRDARGLPALETVVQDLRFACRLLVKDRWFSGAAILVLALAIGANTAIFSLADAALFRMLPVADPDELVAVRSLNPRGQGTRGTFSYPQYTYLRDHTDAVAGMLAYAPMNLNLSAGAVTDSPDGLLVSANYFTVLGVQPAIGRGFAAEDEAAVILSHGFWRRRFAGDPAIAGRSIMLNGLPFTVVGVTPRRFFGAEVGSAPDVFVPLGLRDRMASAGSSHPGLLSLNIFWLNVMARLRPDVTSEEAALRTHAVFQQGTSVQASAMRPDLVRMLQQKRVVFTPASRGTQSVSTQFGTPLLVLMTVVSMVLLIACANVANLLLVRADVRRREIAVRLALGAGRVRLLRQFVTESLVLSTAAGLLGLALAVWSSRALAGVLTHDALDVSLDFRVLSFTLAISLITGVIFGAMPVLRVMRVEPTAEFRGDGSRGGSARRSSASRFLVSGQVAVSLLLLVAAGLFIRTLGNLRAVDPGFDGADVLLATVDPGLSRYTPERLQSFYSALLDRVVALPDVRSASLADAPLLRESHAYIDGVSVEGSDEAAETSLRIVAPRFFETMGIPVRLGRDFAPQDRVGSPRVVIINETFARRYFVGQSPVGRYVKVGDVPMQIVGVTADSKYRGLRDAVPNTAYLPLGQGQTHAGTERTLYVRTWGDPADSAPQIREQVRALDQNLPVEISMFSDLVDEDLVQERMLATLSGFFGGLALVLTATGLYGVIAYGTQRRTREIGVRMALGAEQGSIYRMVLRDGLLMVALGVAAGVPVSFWLSRLVTRLLFEVSPGDPYTFICAVALLTIVAAAAGYLPARRASRINPTEALRYD